MDEGVEKRSCHYGEPFSKKIGGGAQELKVLWVGGRRKLADRVRTGMNVGETVRRGGGGIGIQARKDWRASRARSQRRGKGRKGQFAILPALGAFEKMG